MNILDKIIFHKRLEIEKRAWEFPQEKIQARLAELPKPKDFALSLKAGKEITIIGEVKFKSPSRGIIRDDLDLAQIVGLYQQGGVDAISILTDEKFFGGKPEFLAETRQLTNQPLLKKDFIIDAYQIFQARLLGADGVLLLVRVLPPRLLGQFIELCHQLGMDALVECCTKEEIKIALESGARIIGINNRNLADFTVNLDTTRKLAGEIQDPEIILVAESGIRARDDVKRLADYGVNALLIGEALMASPNILQTLTEFQGVPAKNRVATSV